MPEVRLLVSAAVAHPGSRCGPRPTGVPVRAALGGGVSPEPAAPPLPPKPRIAHGRWPWLAAGGGAMLVLAGFTVWLLIGGEDPGEGYSGPPPSVEFEVKGYKVASAALSWRPANPRQQDGPAARPWWLRVHHGVQRRSQGGQTPLAGRQRPECFCIVSCKLTVKESSPGLEEIRLVRGNREIATLDGVVQSGFDKATAKRPE